MYILYFWPPLWSSGQRPGFDSQRYQIIWEVVSLERGPLSLISTTEKLLKRKSSCFGLENREYGNRDPSRWPCCTFYPQKLALTSPTSGCRSVGRVRSRTQVTEFSFIWWRSRVQLSVKTNKYSDILSHLQVPSANFVSPIEKYPSGI
jgi:hypothetical protein